MGMFSGMMPNMGSMVGGMIPRVPQMPNMGSMVGGMMPQVPQMPTMNSMLYNQPSAVNWNLPGSYTTVNGSGQPPAPLPPTEWGTLPPLVEPGLNPGYIMAAASRPDYPNAGPNEAQYYHGVRPLVNTMADLANYNNVPGATPAPQTTAPQTTAPQTTAPQTTAPAPAPAAPAAPAPAPVRSGPALKATPMTTKGPVKVPVKSPVKTPAPVRSGPGAGRGGVIKR